MSPGPFQPTQIHRHVAVETQIGEKNLLLESISCKEELGQPFEFDLVLLDPVRNVEPDELIGTNLSVRLQIEPKDTESHPRPPDSVDRRPPEPTEDLPTRYFNGYISRLSFQGYRDGAGVYHATVVPWLWFLTRTSDCRIFQDKTLPEIIEETFTEHGFSDFEFRLSGSHRPWECCVQYNETDFNFVSRLMEQEGMYYFWEHENGKHTMVIVDDMAQHEEHPHAKEVIYRRKTALMDEGYIHEATYQKVVASGAFAHNDYNFKKPKEDLRADVKNQKPHAAAKLELFEYPGLYVEKADGEELAKLRVQEAQTGYESINCAGTARGLSCGYMFSLVEPEGERRDLVGRYLITTTSIQINSDHFTTGRGQSGDKFACRFVAIPDSHIFRRGRFSPKPLIKGPQTALVVGPPGEEIYTDEYGRVKLHFYWDRRSLANEKSSPWIRVSQPSAGREWGNISLPRIGQEVVVEFLDGDPDRPIVTGRVYNGENMTPYPLPAEKTKSTFKSNSSKGGGGYNEIRFEDLKGEEQIYVHGQKDMDVRIEEVRKELIKKEQHLIVKGDQFIHSEKELHLLVEKNRKEEIRGEQNLVVARDQSETVGGGLSTQVSRSIRIDAGGNIHISSKAGIFLEVPGSIIAINPGNIVIQSPMVLINSGGSGSPVALQTPEKPTEALEAVDHKSGEVEDTKGMGYAATAENWDKQTVQDLAYEQAKPFYEAGEPPSAPPPPAKPPGIVASLPPPPVPPPESEASDGPSKW